SKRQNRRLLGLCSECDAKAAEGSVFCDYHRERNRERNRQHRVRKTQAGTCLICQQPSVPGKARCQEHLTKQAQSARRLEAKRTVSGLCRRCGEPASDKVYCEDCRSYYRHLDQRRYRAIREEIILLLGGSCAGCGSTDKDLLEIDHIHSDGHRE